MAYFTTDSRSPRPEGGTFDLSYVHPYEEYGESTDLELPVPTSNFQPGFVSDPHQHYASWEGHPEHFKYDTDHHFERHGDFIIPSEPDREFGYGPDDDIRHAALLPLQHNRLHGLAAQERHSPSPTGFERVVPHALMSPSRKDDRKTPIPSLLTDGPILRPNMSSSTLQHSHHRHRGRSPPAQALQRLNIAQNLTTRIIGGIKVATPREEPVLPAPNASSLAYRQDQGYRASVGMPVPRFDAGMRHFATLVHCPSSPYRDIPGAYIKRHVHLKSSRVEGSGAWLTQNTQFRSWLYDSTLSVFACYGPPGVGKSMLVSKAIDVFQQIEKWHAYFYLGHGKVQTAAGVTLALLEQLCVLAEDIPPSPDASSYPQRPKSVIPQSSQARHGCPTIRPSPRRSDSSASLSSHAESSYSTGGTRMSSPRPRRLSISHEKVVARPSISNQVGSGTIASVGSSAMKSLTTIDSTQYGLSRRLSNNRNIPDAQNSEFSGGAPRVKEIPKLNSNRQRHSNSVMSHGPPTLTQFISTRIRSQKPPSDEVLLDLLYKTLQKLNNQVVIILDGWDEDNMVDPLMFGVLLETLLSSQCKIFITSRSVKEFRSHHLASQIDLFEDPKHRGRWSDVQMYVEAILQAEHHYLGRQLPTDFFATSAKIIADISYGHFTTARIYTLKLLAHQHMITQSPRIIRHWLQTQEVIFKDYLTQLQNDPDPVAAASAVLMIWLQQSGDHRLSTEYSDQFQSILDLVTEPGTPNVNYYEVLKRCEPFVAIDHGTQLLYFSSPYVATLVRHEYDETEQSIDIQLAVSKACLEYLERPEFNSGCCDTESAFMELLRTNTFLQTAARWASYLKSYSSRDNAFQHRVLNFLDTRNSRLATQVFLYTNTTHLNLPFESWDVFSEWIRTLPKLHTVLHLGLEDSVEAVLQNQGNYESKLDLHGSTALHEAAKHGFSDAVRIILRDDEIGALDKWNKSPLYYAWKNDHADALVQLFEAQRTDLWPTEDHAPGGVSLEDAVAAYSMAKSDSLARTEAEVKGIALMQAIRNNLPNVAELLMRLDPNPNFVFEGTSLLYAAVEKKQQRIATQLVSAGADPSNTNNEYDGNREPILHLVVRMSQRKTLSALLESGRLDINCVDGAQRTALFTALEYLSEKEVSRIAKRLMSHGLDVDKVDQDGSHVLHIAAKKGFASIISDIIFCSQLTKAPRDADDHTPAEYASRCDHHQAALMLQAAYGE